MGGDTCHLRTSHRSRNGARAQCYPNRGDITAPYLLNSSNWNSRAAAKWFNKWIHPPGCSRTAGLAGRMCPCSPGARGGAQPGAFGTATLAKHTRVDPTIDAWFVLFFWLVGTAVAVSPNTSMYIVASLAWDRSFCCFFLPRAGAGLLLR